MKSYLLSILLLFTISLVSAQNAVDTLFETYGEDPAYKMVNVSPTMFKLIAKKDEKDMDADLKKLIDDLTSMRILSKEDGGEEFFASTVERLSSSLEPLITVNEGGEDVKMFIHEGDEHVEELVMIAHNQDQFVLIDLLGTIDLKTIGRLGEALDAPGLKYLERVNQ